MSTRKASSIRLGNRYAERKPPGMAWRRWDRYVRFVIGLSGTALKAYMARSNQLIAA